MKDDIPFIYTAFRGAWTVLHVLIVLASACILLWWALKDRNAARLFENAGHDMLRLEHQVSSAVKWPWGK